jgi:hypothetical protein
MNMLTRRENLLAALSHSEAQRLPAVFVTDNFNLPEPLPPGLAENPYAPAVGRFLGGDVIDRTGIESLAIWKSPNTRYSEHVQPDGSVCMQWETNRGTLTKVVRPSPEGRTTFSVEFPLKRPEDYGILKRVLEDTVVVPSERATEDLIAPLRRVGDDGIVYTVVPDSPIMDVIRLWAGLERFVYDLYDCPTEVVEVLALMHALNCQHYEIAASRTPGRVLVNWDDVNSLYLSRQLVKQYWVPAIRDYAAIAHKHGKILVLHTCGRVRGILDLFLETGIDAVDWLPAPPTGDTSFADAQELFRGRITLMGAAEPELLRFGSPDAVEVSLHRWLQDVDLLHGFVLLIPCPLGTPLANAARVAKVLARDYGLPLNENPDYWPIWKDPEARW